MALHKDLLSGGFALSACEKHFHDHDETWVILKGSGTSYWIDRTGRREEFQLQSGDVWMVPVGYEHGSDGLGDTGRNSEDFTIAVFNGTRPEGSHEPGHYYVEKENYLPSFELRKAPTQRYGGALDVPSTMRGVIFPRRGEAAFQQEPTPGCDAGTVLCRTLYTGLTNGTERNLLMGGNYGGSWPARCGYQNVGRVLAVGSGVCGIEVGDVVFSGDFCQHREYFAAPATDDRLIVKVPATVDPRHASLFGVASVAMHDVRRGDVRMGERVLVVGAGLIGQFTAQAARLAGAVVTVCDIDATRLDAAASLGAHATVTLTEDASSWAAVRAAGPFDAVFEDSGAPVLDSVIGAAWGEGVLKRRSRVVTIAGRDRVDYSFNAGQGHELSVLHAGHFEADDLHQVCRLAAEGALSVAPLVKDVVEIAEAVSVYDRLRDDPGGLFGVVFDWT